jgi:thiamine-monophosphate kinase
VTQMSLTLRDLGERAITRDILSKYAQGIGDDCAAIRLNGHAIVATTDPVPEPAAKIIGGDNDLYWVGWLLVTINASDLSAAGADPIGFLSALECPPDLEVASFERLLEGIRDACTVEGLPYIGGNLREAGKVAGVGTAIGIVKGPEALTRSGASPDDLLISVGDGGRFWRDALLVREKHEAVDKTTSPLFRPRSQLRAMSVLHNEGVVLAAMDNSDGLLPTLAQLAEANSCRANLFAKSLTVEGADQLGINPVRLWLGWGDWNVVAAISARKFETAAHLARENDIKIKQIGVLEAGNAEVVITGVGGRRSTAPRLESERFARDSWFTAGIDGYIELLKTIHVG